MTFAVSPLAHRQVDGSIQIRRGLFSLDAADAEAAASQAVGMFKLEYPEQDGWLHLTPLTAAIKVSAFTSITAKPLGPNQRSRFVHMTQPAET